MWLVDKTCEFPYILVGNPEAGELIVATLYEHAFVGEWRTGACRNEADPAGLVASSEFPSPLRRRYVAGPAFGFLIGADRRAHERGIRAEGRHPT